MQGLKQTCPEQAHLVFFFFTSIHKIFKSQLAVAIQCYTVEVWNPPISSIPPPSNRTHEHWDKGPDVSNTVSLRARSSTSSKRPLMFTETEGWIRSFRHFVRKDPNNTSATHRWQPALQRSLHHSDRLDLWDLNINNLACEHTNNDDDESAVGPQHALNRMLSPKEPITWQKTRLRMAVRASSAKSQGWWICWGSRSAEQNNTPGSSFPRWELE